MSMHAKHKVFNSNGAKAITNVKVFCQRQTEQKLDAPELHPWGPKIGLSENIKQLLIYIISVIFYD